MSSGRGHLPFGQQGGDQRGACPVAAHPLGRRPGGSEGTAQPREGHSRRPEPRRRGGSEPRPFPGAAAPAWPRRGAEGRGGGGTGNCLEVNGITPCVLPWAGSGHRGPEARGRGVRGDGDLAGSPAGLPGSWPGGGALGSLARATRRPPAIPQGAASMRPCSEGPGSHLHRGGSGVLASRPC